MRRLASAVLAAGALLGCGGDPKPAPYTCPAKSGTICTIAGTGIAGDGDDGLLPLETMIYSPADIAFTPDGALTIVDWNNHRIRAVQADGRLKVVAGVGELGSGLAADDVTDRLNHPTDVTFDPQGRMVIAAWHNSRVKRVDLTTGVIENIAGTGMRGFGGDDGPAATAILNLPVSVVFDPDGNLFVCDQANQRIRKIDVGGTITTCAGSGTRGYDGDGGPALDARFNLPVGQQGHPAAHIARDAAGNIFLADTNNSVIRRIDPAGVISTVAGSGKAGSGGEAVPATTAGLLRPVDIAVAPDGALFIADTENNCVRVVRDGIISTVAGICGACIGAVTDFCPCKPSDAVCLGDGGPPGLARLNRPSGVALDGDGNLYVADTLDHRIRIVYR